MAEFIKGDVGILYVYDTVATAYKPVACLTSNSLSTTLGIIETQTKCDPGETIKGAGSFNYNLSLEGNYIDTTSVGGDTAKASHDFLLTLQQNQATGSIGLINWKLDTGLADTPDYYGFAIISELEADFPTGDEFATFTGTLEGSGAVLTIDPV